MRKEYPLGSYKNSTYSPNKSTKTHEEKLTELSREINNPTIAGNINALLSKMNRTSRQTKMERKALKNVISPINITAIY
jgi:hypothetical protein